VIPGDGRLGERFLTGGAVKAAAGVREAILGCTVIGYQGYDYDGFPRELEGNHNRVVIPGGKNRKKEISDDQETGAAREDSGEAERKPPDDGRL
jgi:hypothetical protein